MKESAKLALGMVVMLIIGIVASQLLSSAILPSATIANESTSALTQVQSQTQTTLSTDTTQRPSITQSYSVQSSQEQTSLSKSSTTVSISLSSGTPAQKGVFKGAYLIYNVTRVATEISFQGVPVDIPSYGSLEIEFSEVNSGNYSVVISSNGADSGYANGTREYRNGSVIGPEVIGTVKYMGDLTLKTTFGMKNLSFYHGESSTSNGTYKEDIFTDKIFGIVMMAYIDLPGQQTPGIPEAPRISVTITLVDTNIGSLKQAT